MQIGQKITITPEKFKFLARHRGLVLIREFCGKTFFLYYCPVQDQYVSSIWSSYHANMSGTPLNASWHLMTNGTTFTVHKINHPTALKHLH